MPLDEPVYPAHASSLAIRWSADYHPEWDEQPGAYLEHGLVGWGRSRRLARVDDSDVAFKAYLGVQHYDPERWNVRGDARTAFFVSLFLAGRTVTVRTYPTMSGALAELRRFHSLLYRL